ncbi:hypothetical protein HHK36_004449 [Tetracentron sinense]|uniref:Uncharacterized protein n=1 Tax=Tetracentron sinense TaxID=13715 RepID=A0A834ZZZ9_TETSI|nr:hypothetical protein HHK36_004449 [Tetracentron sinense]
MQREMAAEVPLLRDTVEGSVDYKGRRVNRSNSGGWRSASFIIGVEMGEKFAYFGVASNLISYLTGPLRESTATAAENVNAWQGAVSLLPLLGAFVADSYLGLYCTIIVSSLFCMLGLQGFNIFSINECYLSLDFDWFESQGLGLLTLSAVLPSLSPHNCQNNDDITSCPPTRFQVVFFFFSLYLVALAKGGLKPCVQAFGADQFDGRDLEECKPKSSFFNWWYFGLYACTTATLLILNYIQDNLNWGLGFGIPCISMAAALVVFLLGAKTYRYSIKEVEKSPLMRIGEVFVAAARNWRTTPSAAIIEEEAGEMPPRQGAHQFK